MKTLENTTNKNLIASLFIAIIILLSGCKKNTLLSPSIQESNNETNTSGLVDLSNYHKTIDLMAGEHLYKVGKVEVRDFKNGTLEVKYSVEAPWKIHSVRLFLGELNGLPINANGECITDLFPYKQLLTPGGSITSVSILIQKTKIPKSGILVANAKIINQETLSVPEDAWSSGTRISKSSMAMYFNYNLIYISQPIPVNPVKSL